MKPSHPGPGFSGEYDAGPGLYWLGSPGRLVSTSPGLGVLLVEIQLLLVYVPGVTLRTWVGMPSLVLAC